MLWLNYFKAIDVLEKERIIDIVAAFIIGFLTPSFSLWAYFGLEVLGFNFNGNVWNDLFYSIFGVGMVEELSKLCGVALAFYLLRKRINEPIDYLLFAGIIALGFSIRENFIYYNNYGSKIITGRTLISCLTHIINTSICVYGLYRKKLFGKGNVYINSAVAITVAVLSHGMFDFFLTQPIIGNLTPFLSSIVYLIGINFWIQMINNAINYSPFFDYHKISGITRLYKIIVWWYIALLGVEFIYACYYMGLSYAAMDVVKNVFKEGLLMLIVTLRISRLSINKRKYYPVKIQSPVYISFGGDEDFRLLGFPIKIRGESPKEFQFIKYMGKDIFISSVKKDGMISEHRKARLLKKYFLKNEVVTYLLETVDQEGKKEVFLLKPKTSGLTYKNNTYPIAILFKYDAGLIAGQSLNAIAYKELKPLDMVYLSVA